MESLQGSLTDAERRVYKGELVRRKLHNIIQVRGLLAGPTAHLRMHGLLSVNRICRRRLVCP